jgi:hypothetical protein
LNDRARSSLLPLELPDFRLKGFDLGLVARLHPLNFSFEFLDFRILGVGRG